MNRTQQIIIALIILVIVEVGIWGYITQQDQLVMRAVIHLMIGVVFAWSYIDAILQQIPVYRRLPVREIGAWLRGGIRRRAMPVVTVLTLMQMTLWTLEMVSWIQMICWAVIWLCCAWIARDDLARGEMRRGAQRRGRSLWAVVIGLVVGWAIWSRWRWMGSDGLVVGALAAWGVMSVLLLAWNSQRSWQIISRHLGWIVTTALVCIILVSKVIARIMA